MSSVSVAIPGRNSLPGRNTWSPVSLHFDVLREPGKLIKSVHLTHAEDFRISMYMLFC
jgi:hypothetical protein